ncbi:MAG TPA: hypothetical protein DCL44_10125 [Elusimicrobia bacterium]|nr:hypothetical protein [Elusimicrobiota bacterium]
MIKIAALLTALYGLAQPLSAAIPPIALSAGLPDFKLASINAADIPSPAAVSSFSPMAGTAEKENIKDWTIMVFLNGKSNIEPFALTDFNRLETVGSSEKVNIIAELGRSKGLDNDTTADGDWNGVRRYYVTKDQDKDHIASPLIMDLGDTDMGDWKEAASFLKWARQAYPAKKYMFIIWDHGWGWIDPLKPGENLLGTTKSISHDFVTGNYIKTTDMGKIFAEAGRVDVYVSMACFMQMAEVAYELRNAADVIVASEEVIQLPSLNFEDFLGLITANPKSPAETAGVYAVDTFKEMYSRPEYLDMLERTKYGTQLSAIRAGKLPFFALKVGAWANLAMSGGADTALKKAKEQVLRFEVGDETTDPDKSISFYGDLYNFAELTAKNLDAGDKKNAALLASGENLKKFISDELVIKNTFVGKDRTGKDYSNTHGIAIDIPGNPGSLINYHQTYSQLAFEKAAGWQKFMKYLEALK